MEESRLLCRPIKKNPRDNDTQDAQMKTKVLLCNVSLSSVLWQPRQWVDQNLTHAHAHASVPVQTLT